MKNEENHVEWEALLLPYYDDQLPMALRQQVGEHIRHCPVCQGKLRELMALHRLLQQDQLPPELESGYAAFWRSLSPRLKTVRRPLCPMHAAMMPSLLYVATVIGAHLVFLLFLALTLNPLLHFLPTVDLSLWEDWFYALAAWPLNLLTSNATILLPAWIADGLNIILPTLLLLFLLGSVTLLYFEWLRSREGEEGECTSHETT